LNVILSDSLLRIVEKTVVKIVVQLHALPQSLSYNCSYSFRRESQKSSQAVAS
jgi:hypothetical protein